MTASHEEKLTLHVEVDIPQHTDRVETPIYRETREQLIERESGRCWVCGCTEQESGHPLQTHHHPVERSLANMIDWPRFIADAKAGHWGPHAQDFDWDSFNPEHPYTFVDNMLVNGRVLCRDHHIGSDEGIHMLPFPLWVAQRYAREGYRFSPGEVIHHEEVSSE